MPVYAWKGLNSTGKSVTGTRDADGPKALRQNLRKDGVFITEHREVLAGGQKAAASGSNSWAYSQSSTGQIDQRCSSGIFSNLLDLPRALYTRAR